MFNHASTSFFILAIVSSQALEVTEDVEHTTVQDVTEVNWEQFPYQVSLHLSYNDEFLCGGSIVASSEVLTVAHCMFYSWGGVLPPLIISVQSGRSNLTDAAPLKLNVKNITFHPSFNKGTLEYDLALIEVNGQFPSNIQIEAATTEKFINDPTVFEDCYVLGWNRESYDLQTLEAEVVECDDVNSNYLGNICVRNKFENSPFCMISSGSSLVCDNKLIGVLSKEANCNNTIQTTVFESVRYATNLLGSSSSSSASVDFEIIKSNTLWSMLSALLSFVFGLLFQYSYT